ncbi:MAG: glycerophosphodiester phosphodiesterase family protein [Wujia sp.]
MDSGKESVEQNMKALRDNFKLFRYNAPSIILFEILYKLLSMAVLTPVIYAILNYSVKVAGIGYISGATIGRYLRSPSTYILAVCIIIIISIYLLINVSALIYAMEASHRQEKTHAMILLLKGLGNAVRVINPKNYGIVIYVLFVLPFTYTVMITGSVINLKVPEFLRQLIHRYDMLLLIIFVLYLILCVISMRRIYALNYFTLYRLNYRDAVMMSRKIIKRKAFRTFFGILLVNLFLTVVLFLLEGTLTTLVAGILKKLISYKELNFVFTTMVQIFFVGLYLVFSVIATPLIYSYICHRFYELEEDMSYKEFDEVKVRRRAHRKELDPEQQKKRNRMITLAMVLIGLVLNGIYIYLSMSNRVSLNIMYPTRALVTAHRGDSANAPENTMAAFEMAVENQADIIELDVRQTSDGVYIIMHDESLARTTGVKRRVGTVDYAYIQSLDAGSKFSKEYEGEHIPTLTEVLEFAKENNVFLNIELKPADTDTDYAQGIVELLEEYDYIDHCVVASADYDVICQMKRLNEDIRTVYIMNMAFGDFTNLEYVDIFSIKHSFISANMVRDIHKHGKDVYAWTVNDEPDIKHLLMLDVDSVITDDPYSTKNIIYNANDTLLSDWLKRLVEEY